MKTRVLILPGLLWMAVFFVAGVALVVLLAFGRTDELGNPIFAFHPGNFAALADPLYVRVLLRSLAYAALASVLCLLIAYPVAYTIAMYGGRYRHALISLIVVPFFASYLVRMYGWSTILADEGWLATHLHVELMGSAAAVIAGLVYGFVVFMILPLYASLERLDRSLIEAGRDLYGSSLVTFFTVTVPATRNSVYAGLVLVFLPAMGDFVSAQLLGGPDQLMIGNLVQDKFFAGQNWPLGSALTLVLMLVLLLCTFGYLRRGDR